MTSVLSAAAGVPLIRAKLRLYVRHCYQPANQQPDPTFLPSPQPPGRWATSGGTVYIAEDELTAWAECCRAFADELEAADPTGGVGMTASSFPFYAGRPVGDPFPPRALFSVEVELEGVADLTSSLAAPALVACGVDPTTLIGDSHTACRALAQAGESLGWRAVRAPSAALDGGRCVGLFAGGVPIRTRWRLERPNARPTVAVAAVTRYRYGRRPSWLA